MGHADPDRGMFDPTRPGGPSQKLPGTRFVIGITVAVVAFAAMVAFAMYWLVPRPRRPPAQRGGVDCGIADADAGAFAIAQSSLTRPAR